MCTVPFGLWLMNNLALIMVLLVSAGVTTLGHAADLSQEGTTEIGLSIGIGHNFHTSLLSGNVEEDIKFVSLMFLWGKIFKKLPKDRSFQVAIEGSVSYAKQEDENRRAVSATPVFIYNFKKAGKVIGFAEAGLGFLYTDLDPQKFGSHLNFAVQAGVGFRYRLADGRFFRLSYRFQHISNGGLDEDNRGIDSNFLIVGISFLP